MANLLKNPIGAGASAPSLPKKGYMHQVDKLILLRAIILAAVLFIIAFSGCATKGPLKLVKTNVGHGVTRYENVELVCYEFIDLNAAIIKCDFKPKHFDGPPAHLDEREF